MNVVCELTPSVNEAFERVKRTPNSCLILLCNKQTKDVEIEGELTGVHTDDVKEKLASLLQPEEPRFLIYHFTLKKDDQHQEGHSSSSILWIHWSPSAAVGTTRMYAATKERIRVNLDGIREAVVSNLDEFNSEWIVKKAAYVK